MFKGSSKALAAVGSVMLASASQAAVTFDTTAASTDIDTVVGGIIAIGVILFGIRKVRSLIKA
jgi:hypothetical protein